MTTTPTRRLKVKLISDFERQGLISQWFGDLQLVAVKTPTAGKRGIGDTLCRVTCANAHLSTRPWWELRDHSRKRICGRCKPRQVSVHNLSGESLRKAIDDLQPARRQLFDALMDSRRRVGGGADVELREILNDALAYATEVEDPEKELRDLAPEGEYETYGKSASLCSPNFMYVTAG
jgi:hypothetical protein